MFGAKHDIKLQITELWTHHLSVRYVKHHMVESHDRTINMVEIFCVVVLLLTISFVPRKY